MVNDIDFADEADFSNEQKFSIKEIILRHIKKISDLSCREFTGSYWEKKPIKTSSGVMFSEVYHDDLREAYCNAIDFLIDIIYPMSNKELKDYLKKYEDYKEEIDEEVKVKEKEDICKRIKLKRQTFRQINIMFEKVDFWKGQGSYNE